MNSQLASYELPGSSVQKRTPKSTDQAMAGRHTCPCCSTILLRHARPGEIYWRCGTCYQEMPV